MYEEKQMKINSDTVNEDISQDYWLTAVREADLPGIIRGGLH